MNITVEAVTSGDGITVGVSGFPNLDDEIWMRQAAIGSRMADYGLATSLEAFEAILREHGCRVSDVAFDPADTATITISYATGADTQRDTVLADADAQIQNAYQARLP